MKKAIFKVAERSFTVLALIFFTDVMACKSLYMQSEGLVAQDAISSPLDPVTSLIQVFIYAVTFFLLIVHWKSVFRTAIRGQFLWVLLGVALASVFWSDFAEITYRRSLTTVETSLFGLYFAARYSLKEQLRLLAWALGIVILFSILFTLAFSGFAIENGVHEGAWRGPFDHKNGLGRLMVISGLIFYLLAVESHMYRHLIWTGFGLSVGLILLSTSKSALVVFLSLLILLPLYRALRWSYNLAIPFLITVVLIGSSVATYLIDSSEKILTALGRDSTLSGRTDIWVAVINKIWERPWLGYGYEAFWLPDGEATDVWMEIGFKAANAHNGFLNLAIHLGLVGLVFFLLSFLITCQRAVAWIRVTKASEDLWPLLYLTFILFYNQAEVTLIEHNSIFWILYVAVTFSLKRFKVLELNVLQMEQV